MPNISTSFEPLPVRSQSVVDAPAPALAHPANTRPQSKSQSQSQASSRRVAVELQHMDFLPHSDSVQMTMNPSYNSQARTLAFKPRVDIASHTLTQTSTAALCSKRPQYEVEDTESSSPRSSQTKSNAHSAPFPMRRPMSTPTAMSASAHVVYVPAPLGFANAQGFAARPPLEPIYSDRPHSAHGHGQMVQFHQQKPVFTRPHSSSEHAVQRQPRVLYMQATHSNPMPRVHGYAAQPEQRVAVQVGHAGGADAMHFVQKSRGNEEEEEESVPWTDAHHGDEAESTMLDESESGRHSASEDTQEKESY